MQFGKPGNALFVKQSEHNSQLQGSIGKVFRLKLHLQERHLLHVFETQL